MFKALDKINSCPLPFEIYSSPDLWTDSHIAQQMLQYHLNPDIDAASRNLEFISKSSDWIIKHFNLGSGKMVADFGCGPGLYTTAFAMSGADVTGIDFSLNSIQYAQSVADENELTINYINKDYLNFSTETRFDLITMIMCDFCVLSPAQRRLMIQKYCSILKPGGSVLLDVFSINAFNSSKEQQIYESNLMNGFWSAEKYYGFMNRFKYENEKVVLDKYTIVEAKRTREVFNWLQHFDPAQLKAEFIENGFSEVEFIGDVAGSRYQTESNEFAIISTK